VFQELAEAYGIEDGRVYLRAAFGEFFDLCGFPEARSRW
jgi:hypothetical protein